MLIKKLRKKSSKKAKRIFLNLFIVEDKPMKIDSPIKKCPILYSCIPFTLVKILAEVKVRP